MVQSGQQPFLPSRTYFICIEVEAAIPLSLDRSLGPQETLYLLVCGLSTEIKSQVDNGVKKYFWGEFAEEE